MLHLLCPLVVCGECPESGSSGLGVATSTPGAAISFHDAKIPVLERNEGSINFMNSATREVRAVYPNSLAFSPDS